MFIIFYDMDYSRVCCIEKNITDMHKHQLAVHCYLFVQALITEK